MGLPRWEQTKIVDLGSIVNCDAIRKDEKRCALRVMDRTCVLLR